MYHSIHVAIFGALYLFGESSYCVSFTSPVNLQVKWYISLVLNQKLNVSFGKASKYFDFNDGSFLASLVVKVRVSSLLLPPLLLLLCGESQLLHPTTVECAADCRWKSEFSETGTIKFFHSCRAVTIKQWSRGRPTENMKEIDLKECMFSCTEMVTHLPTT